jgi:hypothetical protein
VKVALQLEKLLDRSLRRRVDAPFREGKFRRVAEYVHMAIAGAARNFEIHRGASGAGDPCLHRLRRARGGTDPT